MSGFDFVEMFVGVGTRFGIFRAGTEISATYYFIDEMDVVGRHRAGLGGGHDEREQT